MTDKGELRRLFRLERAGIPETDGRRWDEAIFSRLTETTAWRNCRTLLCYVSLPGEVDTRRLIERAWRDAKQVAVPRTGPGRAMCFIPIGGWDELSSGSMGILEPGTGREPVRAEADTLCILPGLSFDCFGYRLGYGGGYYDRFLAGFTGVSAGLCYERMLSPKLPRAAHDMRCDILITERGLRLFPGKEQAPNRN